MNWAYFTGGAAFLTIAYFKYRGIQTRKRNPDKYPIAGLSVLNIESWGVIIICFLVGIIFILKSW